jgi:AmiR/NasT family two-component response regulator
MATTASIKIEVETTDFDVAFIGRDRFDARVFTVMVSLTDFNINVTVNATLTRGASASLVRAIEKAQVLSWEASDDAKHYHTTSITEGN